jgi:hypothetical protein
MCVCYTIHFLNANGLKTGEYSTVHFYTNQYIEQHNESQYKEQNTRNIKNI